MKKRFFIKALLLLISIVPLMAVTGEIVAVKGKAEIKQNGRWLSAQKGTKIIGGNVLSTGFKSELTLKIDGSVIIVKPMTRLTIEEIVQKNEAVSSEVYLNVGSVKADIKPASTKKVEFKVKTPVATASVRGTSGEISADGLLIGTSGTWAYMNSNGVETRVGLGDTVVIDDKGMVTPSQNTKLTEAQATSAESLAEAESKSSRLSGRLSSFEKTILTGLDNKEITIDVGWEED